MALTGRVSEKVSRNRGKHHQVVPIATLSPESTIWTGYREVWERQGSEQNFRFVDAGFTLHVGAVGDAAKPQILRNEWVSRRSRAFVDTAGHPHWQLDVLESARMQTAEEPVRFEAAAVRPATREFSASSDAATAKTALMGLTVEDMHLASSVRWWVHPAPAAAQYPGSVAELDRWVVGSVAYIRQEAARCRVVVA